MSEPQFLSVEIETLRRIVRQELFSFLEIKKEEEEREKRKEREWYPTKQAASLLSLPSADKLRDLRRAGRFKEKTHYRKSNISPNAKRPSYEWHINRCNQVLTEKLSKAKIYD